MRRPAQPALGKHYAGSLVRREHLLTGDEDDGQIGNDEQEEDSAEDDPFAPMDDRSEEDPFAKGRSSGNESQEIALDENHSGQVGKMKMVSGSVPEDEDDEVDSDEAFGEDDAARLQGYKYFGSKRERKIPYMGSENGDIPSVSSFSDGDNDAQFKNGADMPVSENESKTSSRLSEEYSDEDIDRMDDGNSEASSDLSDTMPPPKKAAKQPIPNGDRAALKALLSSDTAAVASSLSAAASADAKKGRAVKAQYQTFDRLLDARIKLQKGLTASNSITSEHNLADHKDAVKAAEEAALTLWNTITSIRHCFAEAQSQNTQANNEKKRKRSSPATPSTPLSTLCSTTKSLSSTTLPEHRTILNKWSAKVRATNPIAMKSSSRLLNDSANHNSITNIIDGYLATETGKLIAQSTNNTTSPTSNHTNQSPSSPTAPLPTLRYDDTTFYQSLLRDLITSRSTTATTSDTPILSTLLPTTANLHPSGSRHKTVDTKASKGRKIRYTIHEKLQNFMAAEGEVGSKGWSEAARNEFFASLMGGRRVLDEQGDGVGDVNNEGEGDVDVDVEALRLFRS